MKYFYFYKITNNINNHFYYGVHCTNNLNDNYMGSGKRLQYAIKKYGIENFSKEILKYFNSKEEAFEYEEQIVNENLVNNPNCYNLTNGGHGSWSHNKGKVTVKDKFGNTFDVNKDDPRYISGELVYIHKGTTTVKDKYGNCFRVKIDDPRYISGELISVNKNVPKKKSSVEKMRNSLKEYYKNNPQAKIKISDSKKGKKGRTFTEKEKELLRGSNNGNSKVLEKDVVAIRVRRKNGEQRKNVYEDYKNIISERNFNAIWLYQTWKHIKIE